MSFLTSKDIMMLKSNGSNNYGSMIEESIDVREERADEKPPDLRSAALATGIGISLICGFVDTER